MAELIYRFDVKGRHKSVIPKTPAAALARLEEGNRQFTKLTGDSNERRVVHFDADELGLPNADGSPPNQKPFAAILSCADARVPVEMILGQACNDLFVVRVAGNVLGTECLGSLDYALSNMDSLRVVAVLGHSNCGAVRAAVGAFIEPTKYLSIATSHSLRAIVDRLFVAVRSAHEALETVYGQKVEAKAGYHDALVHVSVALNSALQAATLQNEFAKKLGAKREVVFGVYDLASRKVTLDASRQEGVELLPPPANDASFKTLGEQLAMSSTVRMIVKG